MKLNVRTKNHFIFGRSEIVEAMTADTTTAEGYKLVYDKWQEVFKKEAKLIVGAQYDYQKIKNNKTLVQFWDWTVEMEVAKAMCHVHKGISDEKHKEKQQELDKLTTKLGVAPSTLGWIYNHPEGKPKDKNKNKKQKTEAASSSAPAKINIPRRLRDGIEALSKTDKSFLESFLDDNGSLKAAVEDLKKKNLAEPVLDNPEQTQKIAELEGELAKIRQEMGAKNRRIQELETNGCALISLMLSHNLTVLKRYKQTFDYVDSSPVVPHSAAGSSESRREMNLEDQVFPHPLNSDIHVPISKLRWPLSYLVGGSKYGNTPRVDELLPDNISTSTTSDLRRLAFDQ